MKCNRCNQKLGDSFLETDDYYLCSECAKELLMDSQSATEGDE